MLTHEEPQPADFLNGQHFGVDTGMELGWRENETFGFESIEEIGAGWLLITCVGSVVGDFQKSTVDQYTFLS